MTSDDDADEVYSEAMRIVSILAAVVAIAWAFWVVVLE